MNMFWSVILAAINFLYPGERVDFVKQIPQELSIMIGYQTGDDSLEETHKKIEMLASVNKTWRKIAYNKQVQRKLFEPHFMKVYEFIGEVETEIDEMHTFLDDTEIRISNIFKGAKKIKIYLVALERYGYMESYEDIYNSLQNLLQKTVDAPVADRGQNALYFLLTSEGREKEARLLIEHFKASPNTQPLFAGSTPLYIATEKGNLPIVELLVEAKADVNLANNDSQDIPLCIAAKRAHFEIVKYLVKHGANITKKCSGNKTALEAAKQKKKKLDRRKEHGDCRSQENYPNLVKIIEFLEEEKREQEVS